MAFGVKSQNLETNRKEKKRVAITKKIKRIVAKHGFDDAEWAQAISSQYFLLCLAKQLNWAKKIMLVCPTSACQVLALPTQVTIY